jgi:hypothetical protein
MQNIQDVENSKKIVLVDDELTKTTNSSKWEQIQKKNMEIWTSGIF